MAEIMAVIACSCIAVMLLMYIYFELKNIDKMLNNDKKGDINE